MADTVRNVPFFNYPFVFKAYERELTAALKDIGTRGAFILQRDVTEFEDNLKKLTNAKYALAVANGTDALIIALRAIPLKPGEEVIFASHTFVATAASVYFAGGIPIPVECGQDHLIDPDSVEAAITPKTRVILPTQLNGRTANMARLMEIAEKHNLLIVEDAAQGLGSKFRGRCAGTFGVAGTISFYPAKNLGSLGDAGAILTDDDRIYDRMVALHDHGRDTRGDVVMWGLNSRLDNLQAAFLNLKIKHYSEIVEKRRHIATLYQELLENLLTLVLPPFPGSEADHFDVYQNYEIEAEKRDDLKEYLKNQGIGTLIQWGGVPVHKLERLGLRKSLPYTERLFTRCLMLPMNDSLTDEDVSYICEKVRNFYRK
jgi:dTDP-4-amino-4,6-dideoxygalactose transaminase